jgi:hypothetical protein
MKNGKKPTKKQKVAIQSVNLNPDNWLITKAMSDKLHIVHRESGKERVIPL